jgi:hypothetical protein
MLNKIRRAAHLSGKEWLLFFQAWSWLLFFDLGLRLRPFPALQSYAARFSPSLPLEHTETLIRSIKTAVDRAGYNHLYPMTCLRRALTLQKMLALKGLTTQLKIGVSKEAGQLSAHAWLEYKGLPLGEPERITERYAALNKV